MTKEIINCFHPDYIKTYMPDFLRDQILSSKNSQAMTKMLETTRAKKPTHGTLFGMSNKVVSLKPTEYMTYSRAGTKNTTVKKKGKK